MGNHPKKKTGQPEAQIASQGKLTKLMKWPGRQERDTKTSNGRGDMLRFFTNEKLFKLQTPLITQTNRVYANRGKKKQTSNGRLYVERQALAKL